MQSVNQTFLTELDRVMMQNKPSTRTYNGKGNRKYSSAEMVTQRETLNKLMKG